MLYKFSDGYIQLTEISSVCCTDSLDKNDEYPYKLKVFMKNGQSHGTNYRYSVDRDKAAQEISDKHCWSTPVTHGMAITIVRNVVSYELDKMRRDFRRLRQEIREKE